MVNISARAEQVEGRSEDFLSEPAVIIRSAVPLSDWATAYPDCGFAMDDPEDCDGLLVVAVSVNPDLPHDHATEAAEHMRLLAEYLIAEFDGTTEGRAVGHDTIVPFHDPEDDRDPFVVLQLHAVEFLEEDYVVYLSDVPLSMFLDVDKDARIITAMNEAEVLLFADADDPFGTVFSVHTLTPGRLAASAALARDMHRNGQ